MSLSFQPMEDVFGRYACIFKKQAETKGGGSLHLGVGSLLISPKINLFYLPKELNLKDTKALVVLDNPPAFGLCPQIKSVILSPIEDSLIAQMIIDRERRLAEITYGDEKVKAKFNEKYVQLELDFLNMPTNINEFTKDGFWE